MCEAAYELRMMLLTLPPATEETLIVLLRSCTVLDDLIGLDLEA